MDNKWSQYVQTTEDLYRSRALRFNDSNKDLWLNAMHIKDGMEVLEVGCAGGLFCHRIKTYLPNTTVTGIDFDTDHIRYAKIKSLELGLDCTFVNGDALHMPFENNSFDLCYSHTVMEHIEPNAFLKEQHRVLKPNGKIAILSVRPALNINPENWQTDAGEEKDLLNKAWESCSEFEQSLNICAYPLKVNESGPILEKNGFTDVSINCISVISYAPDNADISDETAIESINANRLSALSSLYKALRINSNALTEAEIERLKYLINKRYDERIEKYLSGEKLWDIATSTIVVATGKKA